MQIINCSESTPKSIPECICSALFDPPLLQEKAAPFGLYCEHHGIGIQIHSIAGSAEQ